MTDAAILLEARGLGRRYAGTPVVEDVSFQLLSGQVLGLLGLNGAGKSTTLRLLSGELAPSSGEISICGIDLQEEPRRAKANLGYLPEQPPLYRELTVDEYLRCCAALRGIRRRDRAAAVARARRRCGLQERARRPIGQLSKGYQQRVGIAQAIVHDPRVLVLDEPTVGLDPIQMREIRELIRELGRDRGVLVSSHILAEIQASCSHVQILHQGRLLFAAALDDLGQGPGASALGVRLGRPPSADALAAVNGVSAVEPLGGGRFRLACAAADPAARSLVQAAVAGGWDLLELQAQRRSLEQVFVDLTLRGEAVS